METEERDATSRASFKCTNCLKTFTDLEVNEMRWKKRFGGTGHWIENVLLLRFNFDTV